MEHILPSCISYKQSSFIPSQDARCGHLKQTPQPVGAPIDSPAEETSSASALYPRTFDCANCMRVLGFSCLGPELALMSAVAYQAFVPEWCEICRLTETHWAGESGTIFSNIQYCTIS